MVSISRKKRLFESFDDKLVHITDIKTKIQDVLHGDPKKIIASFRKIHKLIYILQGYYYIRSENERINQTFDYSSLEMVASVLNKLKVPWYLGLNSALDLNKIIWQPSKEFIILNSKYSKTIEVKNSVFVFKKMKKNLIKGFNTQQTRNRITIYYANIDKTYLDMIYFRKNIPSELKTRIDELSLIKLSEGYPNIMQNKLKNGKI